MSRDRPLQNSMFLPDQSPRRQSFDYNVQTNVLKKSSTFNISGETSYQPYYLSPNHMSNIGNSPRPLRRESHQNKSVEYALGQINEKIDQLGRVVERHEFQINSQINSLGKTDDLTKAVLNQIRQTLPNLSTNNDVYEHIFNLKLDIKDLQQKLSKSVKENEFRKLETNFKEITAEQNKNFEFLKKKDEYFQGFIGNIQNQISFLKKSLQNHNLQLKVSPIVSNSIILLKYQEVFKVKVKEQSDIIVNEHIYYIDNDGYLLDSNSRYIVDQKGKRVRLEEKHIGMLRNHKILQS